MQFEERLYRGRLVRRYKRFLADIVLDTGEEVMAHCANSGSMMGLVAPDSLVYLSANKNPKAKLDWRWELVAAGTSLVGINTSRPNAIVEEAILRGDIPELKGYATLKREVKYGDGRYGNGSRIDILLSGMQLDKASPMRVLGPKEAVGAGDNNKSSLCYVEVKNATLAEGDCALFPDAVTSRGEKHLRELIDEVEKGARAVMFYLVNRSDCTKLRPADHIDPNYGKRLREAVQKGVELLAYSCKVTPEMIRPDKKIPIDLS